MAVDAYQLRWKSFYDALNVKLPKKKSAFNSQLKSYSEELPPSTPNDSQWLQALRIHKLHLSLGRDIVALSIELSIIQKQIYDIGFMFLSMCFLSSTTFNETSTLATDRRNPGMDQPASAKHCQWLWQELTFAVTHVALF